MPVLAAQDALSRSLTTDFSGGLCRIAREVISRVVRAQNRCDPCIWGHASKLRELSGDPAWVGKLEINYRKAVLDLRQRAIADHASKPTVTPHLVDRADLDALRTRDLLTPRSSMP